MKEEQSVTESYKTSSNEPKGRVLVIDDEEFVRDVLCQALEGEFSVAMVSNGLEGVHQVEQSPPDVLIVDKNLPDISGIEVIEKVKQIQPDVEVLVITAYASIDSAIKALRLGAYDYLTKPFDHVDVLAEKVRRAAEKRKLVLEKRRTERALRDSENLYRRLVKTSPDAIAMIDPRGYVLWNNRRAAEMLGLSNADELVGRSAAGLLIPGEKHSLDHIFDELRENGSLEVAEASLTRKDGSMVPVEYHASLASGNGEHSGAVIITARDLSERKRIQARLAQTDRLASMGVLAAGVAHEINNPLAYVLYNLQSLTEDLPRITSGLSQAWSVLVGQLGPERALDALGAAREYCEQGLLDDAVERAREAAEGARRIRDIVRDLKTFGRLDDGHKDLVQLNHVLEVSSSMAGNQIKFRARLVKDYGEIPPVLASEGRLSQVFLNLLVNAAHAIEEGAVEENEIRIRSWAAAGEVLVEISDTGRGISEEDIGKLFNPFFTTKRIGDGSGLGLSICHSIVRSLGGRIDVESQLGRGSRFIVHLPAAPAGAGQAVDMRLETSAEPRTDARRRILVVDDEPMIGKSMKRALRDSCEVVAAISGAEAKKILEDDPAFDVIISDLMMPDVSGMELYEWLSRRQRELAQRMIFMTGGAFTPLAKEFLERVPNKMFEKPFDTEKVKAMIRDVTEAKSD